MAFRSAPWFVALAMAALIGSAAADPTPRAVVELFTSQGCSSCPPADRVLSELAREPDVVALSLPVDYWDYLGWKDTLAQPAFSARQRAYAQSRGDRQVFTPQMVVNGKTACVGSDRAQVERSILRASDGRPELPVPVSIREEGPTIAIEVGAATGPERKADVWVLPVVRAQEVAIRRGENRGRSVTYANVVRGLRHAGSWMGRPARYTVPIDTVRVEGADGYVVLLQAADQHSPGPILGAAKGPRF
jgi:hypothetical protein